MLPPVVTKGPLPLMPAVCYRCRCYTKKHFIDTGMDTEFEGRIYICNDCMKDFVEADPDSYTTKDMAIIKAEADLVVQESSSALRKYDNLMKVLRTLKIDVTNIIAREERAQKNAERRKQRNPVSEITHEDSLRAQREITDAIARSAGESEQDERNPVESDGATDPNPFTSSIPAINGLG